MLPKRRAEASLNRQSLATTIPVYYIMKKDQLAVRETADVRISPSLSLSLSGLSGHSLS